MPIGPAAPCRQTSHLFSLEVPTVLLHTGLSPPQRGISIAESTRVFQTVPRVPQGFISRGG